MISYNNDTSKFVVYYTKAPPTTDFVAGRMVDEALFRKVSPALAVGAFTQHEALHDAEEAVVVHVANTRQREPLPSLHKDGFALMTLDDFHTEHTRDRLSRDVAMQEAVALVRAACPDCAAAVAFDVTYRNSARNNRNSALGPGGWQSSDSAAVGRVHADFTPTSARDKICTLLQDNPQVQAAFSDKNVDSTNLESKHLAIINVWRPLGPSGTVVRHKPLGLLHPASVAPEEPFPYALVYQNQAGTNASLAHTAEESHQWYYYSEMTPHEALLFYNFHQSGQGGGGGDSIVAPAGTFHAALHSDVTDEDSTSKGSNLLPPRESVEVRVLVLWDG